MLGNQNNNLQELINELNALQTAHEEETGRHRRRLSWLEARRREFFDLVAGNNNDFETRHKLEETENQLAETQQLLARADADLKARLTEIRTRILALRNDELTRLEQEAKSLRQRRNAIHGELLPEAMARVNALQEEENRLGQRIDEVNRRIHDLNKLELPTTQVA